MRFQDFTKDFKISRRFQDFTKDFKISRKISLEVYEISASGEPLDDTPYKGEHKAKKYTVKLMV